MSCEIYAEYLRQLTPVAASWQYLKHTKSHGQESTPQHHKKMTTLTPGKNVVQRLDGWRPMLE
jgi:hypothetical protein